MTLKTVCMRLMLLLLPRRRDFILYLSLFLFLFLFLFSILPLSTLLIFPFFQIDFQDNAQADQFSFSDIYDPGKKGRKVEERREKEEKKRQGRIRDGKGN